MELDAACLRSAKVENLERLARALRVDLTPLRSPDRDVYHRRLRQAILRALGEQKGKAA